ncbi:MAG: hypothetical protein IK079_02225, partial [Desulfovibrio sp.]|nr:hypothetical protein [Desulfovibrio sp.]
MIQIQYTYHHGTLIGVWPGISFRDGGKNPPKKGRIYLGKVIDRDKGIFWTRERGYYIFNPTDQSFAEVAPENMTSAIA